MKHLISAAVLSVLVAAAPQASQAAASKGLVPLTEAQVAQIYSGKTWIWPKSGGGYMAKDGRFTAFARSGTGVLTVEGRWGVAPGGKMCFAGVWQGDGGPANARTCFSHAIKDGDIWQKKEPNGAWYVFKHSVTTKGDEYAHIVKGDQLKM